MKKRKETLVGETYKIATECGNVFVTANEQDGSLFEINVQLGKAGNCQRGLLYLISTQMSLLLQIHETKALKKFIMRNWIEFSCGNPFMQKGKTYQSCIHWVGEKMLGKIKEEAELEKQQQKEEDKK